MQPFVWFAVLVSVFHCGEFALAFIFMRRDLSRRSWLITPQYAVAMLCACLEYAMEAVWVPQMKLQGISCIGLGMMMLGEALRKTAMVTAGHNFTHQLKMRKCDDHQLVTHGIYRFVRHPGYLGWFIWAVGTQVLLVNPFCACAFAYLAWQFFILRISIEEEYLRAFFGPRYEEYAATTPTWFPLIP